MSTLNFEATGDWINHARQLEASGNIEGARAALEDALKAYPRDVMIANAAGNLAMKLGDIASAERHFAVARAGGPANIEYAMNHAIALQRLRRFREALDALASVESMGAKLPKYGSVRGSCAREAGELTEAARWYDAAIAGNPQYKLALHGRARVAIERGEADALARFDRALQIAPGDADLWLGKAQALEVAGDVAGARIVAQQICDQAPGYVEALKFHSGLLLAAGEDDFTAPFRAAAAKAPQDPNIPAVHAETLAGLDHAGEAANVAAQARSRFPNEPHFTLLEAIHSGAAGDWERAEAIWQELSLASPMRSLHEARHRIRSKEFDRAGDLLSEALAGNPWDVTAWALRGIVWRVTADPRHDWLHGQQGLVQMRKLEARDGLIEDAIGALRTLHEGSAMPLGQSLRGGTQTRGVLFQRTEPLLHELHEAIRATLEQYRADLPDDDPTHPLLRHRETPWKLAGSWSVRLTGGGDHHSAHIHQQGLLSSALYLIVPDEVEGDEREGWLEIGRPKPDLGLDLEPLHSFKPVPGHLALFPSTIYHGTTPFRSAERMTVAFDAVADESTGA